jgi:hypothetical protein
MFTPRRIVLTAALVATGCHDFSYVAPCDVDPNDPRCPWNQAGADGGDSAIDSSVDAEDGALGDGSIVDSSDAAPDVEPDTSTGVDGADADVSLDAASDAGDVGSDGVSADTGVDGGDSTVGDASPDAAVGDVGSDALDGSPADTPDVTDSPPSCADAGPATQSCGKCGTQSRVCTGTNTYGVWGACGGEGVCAPGDVRAATGTTCTGALEKATQTCNTSCAWDPAVCALPKGWTKIADPPAGFVGRSGAAVAWTGSKLLVWGGQGASNTYFADGAIYDPATNTWTSMPAPPTGTQARSNTNAIWTGDKFVIWGGDTASSRLADGVVFTVSTSTWSKTSASPLAARQIGAAAFSKSTVESVIWGGLGTSTYADGAIYRQYNDTWVSLPAAPLAARTAMIATSFVAGDVLIWGGAISDGNPLRDGAKLTVSTRTWTKLPDPPIAYVDRFFAKPAATPDGFFVFGGVDPLSGNTARSDGVRFGGGAWSLVPAIPSAVATPAPGWLSAEWCSDVACWVWSGATALKAAPIPLASAGARFDFAASTWTAMPATNAPAARVGAQVAWTGTYAIIWGGADGSDAPFRDGAIYVP